MLARLEQCDASPDLALLCFPSGLPNIPAWFGECDNTVSVSWENRGTAKSSQGQGLVTIYSELLRRRHLHAGSKHLAGELNDVADAISRNDFSLSFPARAAKIFEEHPILATLDYFLPSPELLLLLTSQLFSKQVMLPCVLPAELGQFVPAGSTTSTSVIA